MRIASVIAFAFLARYDVFEKRPISKMFHVKHFVNKLESDSLYLGRFMVGALHLGHFYGGRFDLDRAGFWQSD